MGLSVIEVQSTPNPNAKKFVLSLEVFTTPMSFFTAKSALNHPLASRLFGIDGVTSVLLLGDFVTINKSSTAAWADISKAVKKVLKNAD